MPTTMIVPDAAFQDRTMRLSTLRVCATLNHLNCDVLTVMDPAKPKQFPAGRVAGMDFTQGALWASEASVDARQPYMVGEHT